MTNTNETEGLKVPEKPDLLMPLMLSLPPGAMEQLVTRQEFEELKASHDRWTNLFLRHIKTSKSVGQSVLVPARDYAARNHWIMRVFRLLRDIVAFYATIYIIVEIIRGL